MGSTAQDKKRFRTIGHKLKPIVTVAQKGLTDNILAELDRALQDHELIKARLVIENRADKSALTREIEERLNAECVQRVGHVLLLYRAAKKPDPKLSNLLRPLQ